MSRRGGCAPEVTRFFWPPETPRFMALPTMVSAQMSSPSILMTNSVDTLCSAPSIVPAFIIAFTAQSASTPKSFSLLRSSASSSAPVHQHTSHCMVLMQKLPTILLLSDGASNRTVQCLHYLFYKQGWNFVTSITRAKNSAVP